MRGDLCKCGCGEIVRSTHPTASFVGNHRERWRTRQAQPCLRCGATKEKRRGSRYCMACGPIATRETEQKLEEAKKQRRRAARPPAEELPDGYRRCARCREVLPMAHFPERKAKPSSYCTPCQSAVYHERSLARNFGITPDDYQRLLAAQEGRCAICRTKPRTRRLAVDHNHQTGEVRGLLCTRCNHKVLGAANENPALLRRAAAYLENPPTSGATPWDIPEYEDVQVSRWMEETDEARVNDGAEIGATVVSADEAPVETWPVIVPLDQFVDLLIAAGYGVRAD